MPAGSPAPEGETRLSLAVAPSGHVHPRRDPELGLPVSARIAERIEEAFAGGTGRGLLHLAVSETTGSLGPTIDWWRDLGRLWLTRLRTLLDPQEAATGKLKLPLDGEEVSRFLATAPPMMGIEYLGEEVVRRAWAEIEGELARELRESGQSAEDFLRARSPLWSTVGRVFFHLAENKARPDLPFAFLATYTSRVSAQGKVQHVPLGRAVQEQAAAARSSALLALLLPVKRAAERSGLLRELVDSGRIFHPQAWGPDQAYRFLADVPVFEEQGIFVRVPDWWKRGKPPRLRVGVTVGRAPASGLGAEAILDFSVGLSLDGEAVSAAEWREILAGAGNLALVKGRWVEVDREKIQGLLERWTAVERESAERGISFLEGMRVLAGMPGKDAAMPADVDAPEAAGWLAVEAGDWLRKVLAELRDPSTEASVLPGPELRATLRPYQQEGVRWLHFLHRLRLGGCLADDMGLGKTIQVIALLLVLRRESVRGRARRPALLVLPASLIGNWKSECARFAPGLRLAVAHPSEGPGFAPAEPPPGLEDLDLVITTYGMLSRQPWLRGIEWGLVVLDEAQAIKNPGARQTQSAKALRSIHRLCLTGTPVENRLGDLWSLFDFLVPGLLGSARAFGRLTSDQGTAAYARIRSLVGPCILRRMKTDRRIVADLPDKEEVKVWCGLRKAQAALYELSVEELARTVRGADGMRRRGTVLAFLMRLKQICNHPSQWTGDGAWDPADSGKMGRLVEICEEIAARQEKVLVFTQFKEIAPILSGLLEGTFGRPGQILDGDTPVKRRKDLVDAFAEEDGPPFFVLSLKAGGTGLNLTAASHVIHFDRWWNPAVENQATDRAYRIGQKRNVLVHKFVCRGTVEEKIDEMIEGKQGMANEILRGGAEGALTEMSDEDLLRFVSIDIRKAVSDG